jgi:hypothetical protein
VRAPSCSEHRKTDGCALIVESSAIEAAESFPRESAIQTGGTLLTQGLATKAGESFLRESTIHNGNELLAEDLGAYDVGCDSSNRVLANSGVQSAEDLAHE